MFRSKSEEKIYNLLKEKNIPCEYEKGKIEYKWSENKTYVPDFFLLKNGIIPLYIFDGKPPEEKQDILNDRKERKEFLIKKKKLLEKILKGEEVQDEVMQKYIYEVKEKSEKELSTELQKVKKKIMIILVMLHFKMVEAKVEVLVVLEDLMDQISQIFLRIFLENLVEEEATREVRATEVQI